VGRFLIDRPRDILYKLAESNNVWERRTAIVSTAHFLKQGEVEDTFRIAEILIDDEHEMTHKAVGSWLREAGQVDELRLKRFLEKHGAAMSRVALRLAIAKLDEPTKKQYLAMA
jgi:3-methyladenine DNA glycosylase AlkD